MPSWLRPSGACSQSAALPLSMEAVHWADSLHTRKAVMFDQCNAVLALPGGLGTLDELVEILSWRNLRLHAKPVWLLGDRGFWDPFLALLRHTVETGFSSAEILSHVTYLPDTDALAAHLPPP